MRKIRTKLHMEQGDAPAYASKDAAGCDLRYCGEAPVTIYTLERVCLRTGVRIALPEGYEAQVRGRSGLNWNHGIVVPTGTIDADYRGDIGVVMYNLSKVPFTINPGDRIAQLVVCPVVQADWVRVQDPGQLGGTERGENGFGSTGR